MYMGVTYTRVRTDCKLYLDLWLNHQAATSASAPPAQEQRCLHPTWLVSPQLRYLLTSQCNTAVTASDLTNNNKSHQQRHWLQFLKSHLKNKQTKLPKTTTTKPPHKTQHTPKKTQPSNTQTKHIRTNKKTTGRSFLEPGHLASLQKEQLKTNQNKYKLFVLTFCKTVYFPHVKSAQFMKKTPKTNFSKPRAKNRLGPTGHQSSSREIYMHPLILPSFLQIRQKSLLSEKISYVQRVS